MTQSKLGTGANYAGLTGFTWPANHNPRTFNVPMAKRHKIYDMDYNDINMIQDSGSPVATIALTGELFTAAEFNNLRKQINYTSLTSVGEIQNYNQKLYLNSSTKFYWVRGGQFLDTQTADLPTSFPYNCTLLKAHPWLYHDALAGTSGTTTGTTKTISGAGLNNDGTAYVVPWFEITNNTGSNITLITVTDGTNTLTWDGTLESGKSLRLIQEDNAEYGLTAGTAYKYNTTDFTGTPTSESGFSGDKSGNLLIFFLENSDSHSIDFGLTGNDDTATVAVRFRERDY